MINELVVVSGKGGTGKTSVVASLAELATGTVLVDCDVDASNLHLLLPHEVKASEQFIAGKKAYIDPERCSDCGDCEANCRFEAIRVSDEEDGRYSVDQLACDGCGVCTLVCPEKAATLKEVVSGEWFISETPRGPFVHARLDIAQSNSGRLVSLLRREARSISEARQLPLIIADGPPGIGCPVIAAITGASFVLIVTEPSLSARHDMQRLLDLTRHFKLPVGLCINKCDIDRELASQIETTAGDSGIPVLGRIPFDGDVARAIVDGKAPFNRCAKETQSQLEALWRSLQSRLGETAKARKGMHA